MSEQTGSHHQVIEDGVPRLGAEDHRTTFGLGGQLRHRIVLPGPLHGVAFAPDGKHLATGNGNGTVYVLRLPER